MVDLIILILLSIITGLIVLKKREITIIQKTAESLIVGIAIIILEAIILNYTSKLPLIGKILNINITTIFIINTIIFLYYYKKEIKILIKKILEGKKIDFKITKKDLYILTTIILVILLTQLMYLGSIKYPWLEDGDPWDHATAANYIKNYNTFDKTKDMYISHYLAPYPPGYAIIQSLTLNNNTINHLKLINSYIIGLILLAAFLFYYSIIKKEEIALVGTTILLMLPGTTHFIFAQPLAFLLSTISLYYLIITLQKIKEEKNYSIEVLLYSTTTTAVLLTQQLISVYHIISSIIIIIMYMIYIIIEKTKNKEKKEKIKVLKKLFLDITKKTYTAIILLVFFTTLFYGTQFINVGKEKIYQDYTIIKGDPNLEKWYSFVLASEKRCSENEVGKNDCRYPYYTFKDFYITKAQNSIDVAKGYGKAITIYAIIGLIILTILLFYRLKNKKIDEKTTNYIILFLLFLFTFLGVNSDRFIIKILPHRWWSINELYIAIIGAITIITITNTITNIIKQNTKNNKTIITITTTILIILLLLYPVYVTSYKPKIELNNSLWPPHMYPTGFEYINYIQKQTKTGYLKLTEMPGEKTIDLCSHQILTISNNQKTPQTILPLIAVLNNATTQKPHYRMDLLDENGKPYKINIQKIDVKKINDYLEENKIEYLTIGTSCYKNLEEKEEYKNNETKKVEDYNKLIQYTIQELQKTNSYTLQYNDPGIIILKKIR